MRRLKALPIILVGIGATLVLLLVSSRGGLQSSLLEDPNFSPLVTVDQLPTNTSTGALLKEFTIFEERNVNHERNMNAVKDIQDVGFYFPHVYRVKSENVGDGGGAVAVALHLGEEKEIQRGIRARLEYPEDVLDYAGPTSLSNQLGTIFIEGNQRPGEIDLQFVPNGEQQIVALGDFDPFVLLPFKFTNFGRIDRQRPLLLSITSAQLDTNELRVEEFPFFNRPVDVLYFERKFDTEDGTERDVLTTEVPVEEPEEREVPTYEPPAQTGATVVEEPVSIETPVIPTVSQPTSGQTGSTITETVDAGTGTVLTPILPPNEKSQITADQTRLSPAKVQAGSGERVFVYLSVADPEGINDISSVSIDLSNFGLPADRAMVQTEVGPNYAVYITSFELPAGVIGSEIPYSIPYNVTDKGGNLTTGSLSLEVEPAAVVPTTPVVSTPTVTTAPTTTTTTPVTSTVPTTPVEQPAQSGGLNVDLDGNGVVGEADLLIYLDAYGKTANTTTTQALIAVPGTTSVIFVTTDVNGDGKVDGSDLTFYQQAYALLKSQ